MSCIWNIQNTYQNSSKAYILRRLRQRDVKYCFTKSRYGDTCKYGHESDGNVMHDKG